MNVTVPSHQIVMHLNMLTLDNSTMELSKEGTIYELSYELDAERHFLTLNMASQLPPGVYYFKTEYNGTLLHRDLGGFYLSSYDEGEVTK